MDNYLVSGAGSSDYNGLYTYQGIDGYGNPCWQLDGSHLLTQCYSYEYFLAPWNCDSGPPYYYSNTEGGDPSSSSSGPWGNFYGNYPVPTVTAVSPVDTTPPVYTGAVVEGDGVTWKIYFTDATLPLNGTTGFTATVNGSAATFSGISISGGTITATCSLSAASGDAVLLSYAPGDFTDNAPALNPVASFTDAVVAVSYPITPTPLIWLNPSSIINTSGNVNQWNDISGNGFNFTGTGPTLISSVINGFNGVRFGGNQLSTPYVSGTFDLAAVSVYLVAQWRGDTGHYNTMIDRRSGSGTNFELHLNNGTNEFREFNGSSEQNTSWVPTANHFYVFEMRGDQSGLKIAENGNVLLSSSASIGNPSMGSAPIALGAYGGEYAYIDVCEVLIYSSKLSDGDAATLYTTLANIYFNDTTPPTFGSATIGADGQTWTINLVENDTPPIIGTTGFTATVNGVGATFSGLSISGTTITATCSVVAVYGQTATISYTPGTVTDSATGHNHMLAFTNQAVTNLTAVTALYLQCEGSEGSQTFVDSTGLNTVTANNNAHITSFKSAKGNSSALFNFSSDTSDSLSVSSNTLFNFGAHDFTVEFWAYFVTNNVGYQWLIDRRSNSDQTGWMIYLESNNQMRFLTASGGSWDNVPGTYSYIPAINQWHHYAFVRYGTNFSLYCDGSVIATTTVSSGYTIGSQTVPLTIGGGHASPGNRFRGYMDDIKITFNQAIYTGPFTPPYNNIQLFGASENNAALLSWVAPVGTGWTYNVYAGSTSGGESSTPIITGTSSISTNVSGLTNGVDSYYYVKAHNSTYTLTNASNEVKVRPQAPIAGTSTSPSARYSGDTVVSANPYIPLMVWKDVSGNFGKDLSASYNIAPIYLPNALNNLPILNFNGSRYFNSLYQFANGNPTTSTGLTVFIVARGTSPQSLVRFQDTNNPGYIISAWDSYDANAPLLFSLSNDGGTGSGAATNIPTDNTWFMTEVSWNYNTTNGMKTWLNAVLQNQRNSSSTVLPAPLLSVGSTPTTGSENTIADIAEIIIYETALSPTDRIKIEDYLTNKYAIIDNLRIYPGNGNAILSWNAPIGTGWTYNVYQGIFPGSESVSPVQSGLSTTTCLVTNLEVGQTYYFTVEAQTTLTNIGSITITSPEISADISSYINPGGVTSVIPSIWLKADSISGVSNEQKVSVWSDSGLQGVIASSHNNPTYVQNCFGNLPAVRFNGSSGFATTYTWPPNNAFSIFAVARAISYDNIAVVPGAFSYPVNNHGNPTVAINGEYNGSYNIQTGIPYDNSWFISSAFYQLNTLRQNRTFLNGVLYNVWNSGGGGLSASQMFIGYDGGSDCYLGDIAEIIIYPALLCEADRIQVERYLNLKYGTPQNLCAVAGNSQVTLNWVVSLGTDWTYNVYQGYSSGNENSVPVQAGLTTTTATITGLNNNQTYYYYVKAVDPYGRMTSASNEVSPTTGVTLKTVNGMTVSPYFWIRSDELTGSNNSSITFWQDYSSHGNNITQLLPSAQPVVITSGINGLHSARFNGSTNMLSTYFSLPYSTFNNLTIYAVYRTPVFNSNYMAIVSTDGVHGGYNRAFGLYPTSGDGATNNIWIQTANSALNTNTWDIYNRPQLTGVEFTASGTRLFHNSGLYTNGGVNSANSVYPLNIGNGVGNGAIAPQQGAPMDLSELIIFTSALSDNDRHTLENYLSAKYFSPQHIETIYRDGEITLCWENMPGYNIFYKVYLATSSGAEDYTT